MPTSGFAPFSGSSLPIAIVLGGNGVDWQPGHAVASANDAEGPINCEHFNLTEPLGGNDMQRSQSITSVHVGATGADGFGIYGDISQGRGQKFSHTPAQNSSCQVEVPATRRRGVLKARFALPSACWFLAATHTDIMREPGEERAGGR